VSAPVTRSRASRRLPIVVVVILAIGAGVAAGHSDAPRAPRPVEPVDATQLPKRDATSTAWYCPGLPADFPLQNQTFTLSNLSDHAARAAVTVHPDGGADPVTRNVTIPHGSVKAFQRASLPNGPLVIEPFSPDVVVSAGLESDNRLATVPCANTAGADWYFAGGTTVRGVTQWLVLQNPFAADARVDVTLRTDSGLQQPQSLAGQDVPGRSRIIIPIHDVAVRQSRVSVQVHAELGRVVASQTITWGSTTGAPGVATTIGVVKPASDWWFVGGDTRAGASEFVAIANVGQLDARVNVQAQAGSETIVHPVQATVPSGGVNWVQIGGCEDATPECLDIPSRTRYVLLVQSDSDAPIVAQTLTRFDGENALGAASSVGSSTPARQWVVPRTYSLAHRSTSIVVSDPGLKAATVSVTVVRRGHIERPPLLQGLKVAPGAPFPIAFGVPRALRFFDGAIVITSDVPIFAGYTMYAESDATRAPAIPAR
jgi:hypothetical protein